MNTTPNATAATDDNIIDGTVTDITKPDNALVILNPVQFATELFKPFEDQLAALRRAAGRAKYDIATDEGMAKAKELRATAVKIRTTADKAKTEAKRPIDQSGKLLLEHFRKIEEAARAEEKKHAEAIDAEEQRQEAERQRKIDIERALVEALQAKVDTISLFPTTMASADSTALRAALDEWSAMRLNPADFQEYANDALEALNTTVDRLRDMLIATEAREAAERKAADERAELERLRAQQAERDAAEAKRKAAADAAAANAARQLAEQQAAMQRQQQLMNDIQHIQQVGMRTGDARAVMDNLEYAQSIDVSDERYGDFASMAKMAKDMAVAALQSRYAAALASELPEAWAQALDEDAERAALAGQAVRTEAAMSTIANLAPIEEDHTGRVVGVAQVLDDEPKLETGIVEPASAGYVDQDAPPGDGGTAVFRRTQPYRLPEVPRRLATPQLQPSDSDIVEAMAVYFGQPRATIAAWIIGMDLDVLRAIAAESAA